jgi:DNA-directed RNA polymerase specialized sigma24 family protein
MNLTQHQLEEITKNAKSISARYKRKCWWVSREDVQQECFRAQLEALRTFDPCQGIRFGAYAYRAAEFAASNFVLGDSAPVSARRGHKEVLLGILRAPIDPRTPKPPAQQEEARANRIRRRAEAILGPDTFKFLMGVLVEGWDPQEVAQHHKVPVSEVRKARVDAINALMSDTQLWKEWRDR